VLLLAIHNITNSFRIQPILLLLRWYNMPPRRKKQPPISVEWAESLIGLSMRVPDDWWVGCTGQSLHDGKIVSFNIECGKWNLLLDTQDDGDDLYFIFNEL
jgi:hypothetical protein